MGVTTGPAPRRAAAWPRVNAPAPPRRAAPPRAEFRKLWRHFDSSGDGSITYAEFNNKVGRMIAPMSEGLQMNRPSTPKMKDWQRKALAAGIRKKISDIDAAFREIDTDGSGLISHAEFIQVRAPHRARRSARSASPRAATAHVPPTRPPARAPSPPLPRSTRRRCGRSASRRSGRTSPGR